MCGQNIEYARFISGQKRTLFACGLTDELIPGISDSRYCWPVRNSCGCIGQRLMYCFWINVKKK
jgi:hypothetical protein